MTVKCCFSFVHLKGSFVEISNVWGLCLGKHVVFEAVTALVWLPSGSELCLIIFHAHFACCKNENYIPPPPAPFALDLFSARDFLNACSETELIFVYKNPIDFCENSVLGRSTEYSEPFYLHHISEKRMQLVKEMNFVFSCQGLGNGSSCCCSTVMVTFLPSFLRKNI